MAMDASFYKILVVEDDFALSLLIRKRLEQEGFATEFVTNGKDALAYLCEHQNVLMLLDYQLGDMNAAELVDNLAKSEIDTPFIVITGQGSETIAIEMMKLGARDYIIKNVSFLQLLPTVVKQTIDKITIESKLARTEEALRKEKTHLLNNIPDMVFQIDEKGILTSLNPAVTKILAYSCEEMLGKNINRFVHPDELKQIKNDYEAVKKGQQILRHPIRFLHKDGSIRWMEGNIVAIYDDNKIPTGISAIYQDITQEKTAYDELIEAEERFHLLAESSPGIVIEMDVNSKLISLNKAGRKFFHFDNISQLVGKDCLELFDSDWRMAVEEALKQAKEGETINATVQIASFCGQLRWFDIIFSPLRSAEGKVVSIVATAWDVSERVQREKSIRQLLDRNERLAEEATILQNIALSAGSGVDMKPAKVVEAATLSTSKYIRCQAAFGYLLAGTGQADLVTENKDMPPDIKKEIIEIFAQLEVVETVRRLRTPKKASNTLISEVAKTDSSKDRLFESTVLIPLVNAGKNYGFLVFVDVPEKLEHAMSLFSMVSNCAGLAIANAHNFQLTSTRLKNRMMQLENFSKLGLVATSHEQMNHGLEAIVESGVNFVHAKSGVIILHNEPAAILYGTAGSGLAEEDIKAIVFAQRECLVWECMLEKKSLFYDNINQGTAAIGEPLANLTEKSLLCVPLVDHHKAIGVMVIIDQSIPFDTSHTSVLEAFAGLAVQTVNNAKLAEKASELDQKLAEIRKISRTISSSRDINSVLRQICQGTIEILGAEMAWIGMISNKSYEVKYRVHAGRNGEYIKKTVITYDDTESGCGPTGIAIKTSKPAIVNNIKEDKRLSKMAKNRGFNSCCSVPIVSKKNVLGALTLFHSEPGIFSAQNVTLLEEFSDQAAIAIFNVQLRSTLLESESLKDIILQSVNEALIVIDWTGAVIRANSAAEKLFAREHSRFKNCCYTDLFSENNCIADLTAQWLNTKNTPNTEGWVEIQNGNNIYIAIEAKNVVVERMPCLLLTVTDLTMQKKMNASLEHAAKLTTVGRISTQIAHEIGNPLSLISSQVQRMITDEKPDIDKLKGLLGHIDRIANLIRRFSDLGGKSPLSSHPEPISPVIENVLSLVAFSKPFEGVDIEKQIQPDIPIVNIDKNKITQVLLNLLLNAADACRDQGKILLTAQKTAVPVEINNEIVVSDYLLISIRDNGSGIDPDTLKHIFEPFYTTKDTGKGTGLGLSVSLAIVDQHHGWIDVNTDVGNGSTFSVFLPMKPIEKDKAKLEIKTVDYGKTAEHKREKV